MAKLFTRSLYALVLLFSSTLTGLAQTDSPPTRAIGFWAPQRPPRARYEIDCEIELADGLSARGRATIHFVNTASRSLQTLAIDWLKFGEQTLTIEANGEPVDLPDPIPAFPQDFSLVEPVRPGQPLTLEVEFAVSVPAPPGGLDQIGPVDAWPQLWWGFPTHNDYVVKLKAPEDYAVVTSGRFDAATGSYHARSIPSFGLVLLKGYQMLEEQTGDVVVRCFHKAEDAGCAKLLEETAVDVIGFYRDWLDFYPYRTLNIIPGMDQPAGGYPAATNIVVIHGMSRMGERPELHWRWITAHEVAHQYWGEHVLEKDDPGWLWIGLGIYVDREYCRARDLGNQKHRELMARYIEGVRQELDTTINRSQEERSEIKFDFNNVVIHGKGFAVISALDCLLGEELFGRIHRRCLKEFAGCRLGVAEFRAFCEQESGRDLGWFFDQWVNSNKYLSYEIASQKCEEKGDSYITEIEVRCLGSLRMPVPVSAEFEDGTSQVALTNRLRDVDTIRFESRSPLKRAQLDPEEALALVVPPAPPEAKQVNKAIQDLP